MNDIIKLCPNSNHDISTLAFTKEEVEILFYRLESKVEKVFQRINYKDSPYHKNESFEIGYLRNKDIHMAVCIEEIDGLYENYAKIFSSYADYNELKKEGYRYSIWLHGFKPQDCITYVSNKLYIQNEEDIERKVISLILGLLYSKNKLE